MVESAPRFELLRTGETGPDANTTECLGYGDGVTGWQRQLQQREKLSKTEVGSPSWTRFELSPLARLLRSDPCSSKFNSLRRFKESQDQIVALRRRRNSNSCGLLADGGQDSLPTD